MKKITKVFGVALFAISMMVTGCSNPGDNDGDKSSPAPSEQPAPETPETPETPSNPEFENPESEDPDSPPDSGETETEDTVTFETLGVADFAESLAGAIKKGSSKILNTPFIDLVYDINEHGFVPAEFDDTNDYIGDGTGYIFYVSPSDKTSYFIPESMESDFDTAITAYKAAHAE